METELNKQYFQKHSLNQRSAAGYMYNYQLDSLGEEVILKAEEEGYVSAEDLELEKKIAEAETPDALFRLMRTAMNGKNRMTLRAKVLKNEEDMLSVIKKRCLTTLNDYFIDDVVWFFRNSKENCSDWIVEHYGEIRSDYLKSMICLDLGYRAEPQAISFLMKQVDAFEQSGTGLGYEQGPLFALNQMWARFGDVVVL